MGSRACLQLALRPPACERRVGRPGRARYRSGAPVFWRDHPRIRPPGYLHPATWPVGQRIDPSNDAAVLLLEFANGAQGTLQVSAAAYTDQLQTIDVELHGASGSLSASLPWQSGARLSGVPGAGQPAQPLPVPEELWCGTQPAENYMDRFAQLLCRASIGDRLFIDSILAGTLPQPNLSTAGKSNRWWMRL